jgi:hypothetical protein
VLKRSGPGEERWLTVPAKSGSTEWSISDSPGGGRWYMLSGAAGSCCPADPGALASTTKNFQDWRWRDGLGYTEGGVSVECSAHNMQTQMEEEEERLKMELREKNAELARTRIQLDNLQRGKSGQGGRRCASI